MKTAKEESEEVENFVDVLELETDADRYKEKALDKLIGQVAQDELNSLERRK